MSYAVRDFFQNGGSQAIIVRRWFDSIDPATKAAIEGADKNAQAAIAKAAAAQTAAQQAVSAQAGAAKASTDAATAADAAANAAKTAKAAADKTAADKKATPEQVAAAKAKSDQAAADQATADQAAAKASADATAAGQAVTDTQAAAVQAAADQASAEKTAYDTKSAAILPLAQRLAPDAATTVQAAVKAATDAATDADAKAAAAKAAPNDQAAAQAAAAATATAQQTQAAALAAVDSLYQNLSAGVASFSLAGGGQSGKLLFEAVSPGSWANDLLLSADSDGITPAVVKQYASFGLSQADLFNFSVGRMIEGQFQVLERFTCVTVNPANHNPYQLQAVLGHQSNYVKLQPNAVPAVFVPLLVTPPDAPADAKPKPALSVLSAAGVDSRHLTSSDDYLGDEHEKSGLYALTDVDIFNLVCIPFDPEIAEVSNPSANGYRSLVNVAAATFCSAHNAFFIAEPHPDWLSHALKGEFDQIQATDLEITGPDARYAASYFPRVIMPDPKMQGRPRAFSACGILAGQMASTDLARGVWKAPAGQDAALVGVTALEYKLDDAKNGVLNQVGVNCLRSFPVIGPVIWGDRTLRGADLLSDDYKYVNVRRLTNFIEESLKRSTRWAVFEDNDENLWSTLRLSIGGFMADLARQGAFYNYQVICDATTTKPDDIAKGVVNVHILFAPVKPAEFVLLQFQQTTSQAAS